MHTAIPSFVRAPPSPAPAYRREFVDVCLGGRIALDWLGEARPGVTGGRHVLILLHGLTGGSHETYVQFMAIEAAHKHNMAVVVMNARGCAETALASAQGYCGCWTEDVRQVAALVRERAGPKARVFAAGFSLGAGVLSKYLVEEGSDSKIDAGASLCPSLDFVRSVATMESPMHAVTYNRVLRDALLAYFERHAESIERFGNPKGIDFDRVRRSRLVREFDGAVVAPMFGYDSAWDYYHDATTAPFLATRVAVPLLTLSAADDPICDVRGVPTEAAAKNPRLFLGVTSEGGHVAWSTGMDAQGKYWYPDVCLRFFDAVAKGMAPGRAAGIEPRVGRASVGAGARPGPVTIGITGDASGRKRVIGLSD